MSLKEPKKKLDNFHVCEGQVSLKNLWKEIYIYRKVGFLEKKSEKIQPIFIFCKDGFFENLKNLKMIFKLVKCQIFYKEPLAFLNVEAKSRLIFLKVKLPIENMG